MRKWFKIVLPLVAAMATLVAGPAQATGICNQKSARTSVERNGNANYDAFKGDIVIPSPGPFPLDYPSGTNHWIGVEDGYFIAQTGIHWYSANNGNTANLGFWWQLNGPDGQTSYEVMNPTGVFVGDVVLFSMWYQNQDEWGVNITDTTPNPDIVIYAQYVHPVIVNTAAAYEGPSAEVATELHSPDQLDDGTVSYIAAQARENGTYVMFQNETNGMADYDLGNSTCGHFIETNDVTNANGYTYQHWINPS